MLTIHRTIRRAAVLTGLLFSAACSTDMLAPEHAPRVTSTPTAEAAEVAGLADALRSFFNTTVLARSTELAAPVTVITTIGSGGGLISIPQVGFELVVPRGAVTKDTKFTVTALAGKAIAYDFGPHGTTFKKPLTFRQHSFYTTGWWNATSGGYFMSTDQVDVSGNKAKVDEVIPMTWDGSWMTLDIKHFSGYLVSCA